jgi:hypothetical protein
MNTRVVEVNSDEAEGGTFSRGLSVEQRNRIAEWASLTQTVLGRFHLRLEDVEDDVPVAPEAFVGSRMEKRLALSVAATAIGTYLFGKRGEGRQAEKTDKSKFNTLKKQADAISAYILSEGLFYSTRGLPENHAIMVSVGEGAMPKAGELPEQGANPQLAFGRIYARPQVAMWLQDQVRPLLNPDRSDNGWAGLWQALQKERITVWGAAIDQLENTTRFTRGESTGPLVVCHVFDQPLTLACPYESYSGMLSVPAEVHDRAVENSRLLNYLTPRAKVFEAIQWAYPDVTPDRIHVWTLGGATRVKRIGKLWAEWEALGVHIVEDGWEVPGTNGGRAFRESGTYAPIYRVGAYLDDAGQRHVFVCDGYAATAEAIQAASLDPVLGIRTSMCLFTPDFQQPYDEDWKLMHRTPGEAGAHRDLVENAIRANIPLGRRTLSIDDFLPLKEWRCLALSAAIEDDPYSTMRGVERIGENRFRVAVRLATNGGNVRIVRLSLSLELSMAEARRAFLPLLDRFWEGEKFEDRAVKSSDIGRIMNELRTWSWNSVIDLPDGNVLVNLSRVDEAVIPRDKKQMILDTLRRYKEEYPALTRRVLLDPL